MSSKIVRPEGCRSRRGISVGTNSDIPYASARATFFEVSSVVGSAGTMRISTVGARPSSRLSVPDGQLMVHSDSQANHAIIREQPSTRDLPPQRGAEWKLADDFPALRQHLRPAGASSRAVPRPVPMAPMLRRRLLEHLVAVPDVPRAADRRSAPANSTLYALVRTLERGRTLGRVSRRSRSSPCARRRQTAHRRRVAGESGACATPRRAGV